MSEEKRVHRYSLQFNTSDPVQKYALEVLAEQGRHKSSFIARAIKYYVMNSPDLRPVTAEPPDAYIKSIVEQVLSVIQQSGNTNIPTPQPQNNVLPEPKAEETKAPPPLPATHPEPPSDSGSNNELDDQDISEDVNFALSMLENF